MKTLRKLNKWMVMQEGSNIGLLLFIVVFVAMLCTILTFTTVGYNIKTIIIDPFTGHQYITDAHHIMVSDVPNPSYGLAVTSTVMGACAWLAIAAGWYLDPTKLDERLSTTLAMGFLALMFIFGVASVGQFNSVMGSNVDKGYVAGNLIMIIIPTLLSMALLADPMIQSFNPNNKNEVKKATK